MVTKTIDLRSDTVTKPTETMRAAMANADVDDDVLGSDPTAHRFEAEVAKMMGKEAAIFVPSGTMSNLIGVLVHCEVRGSEVILGDNSHIHVFENGGISTIGGVHTRTVKNNLDGTMDLALIEGAIRDPAGELLFPTTRLICLENTHAKSDIPFGLRGCMSSQQCRGCQSGSFSEVAANCDDPATRKYHSILRIFFARTEKGIHSSGHQIYFPLNTHH